MTPDRIIDMKDEKIKELLRILDIILDDFICWKALKDLDEQTYERYFAFQLLCISLDNAASERLNAK